MDRTLELPAASGQGCWVPRASTCRAQWASAKWQTQHPSLLPASPSLEGDAALLPSPGGSVCLHRHSQRDNQVRMQGEGSSSQGEKPQKEPALPIIWSPASRTETTDACCWSRPVCGPRCGNQSWLITTHGLRPHSPRETSPNHRDHSQPSTGTCQSPQHLHMGYHLLYPQWREDQIQPLYAEVTHQAQPAGKQSAPGRGPKLSGSRTHAHPTSPKGSLGQGGQCTLCVAVQNGDWTTAPTSAPDFTGDCCPFSSTTSASPCLALQIWDSGALNAPSIHVDHRSHPISISKFVFLSAARPSHLRVSASLNWVLGGPLPPWSWQDVRLCDLPGGTATLAMSPLWVS